MIAPGSCPHATFVRTSLYVRAVASMAQELETQKRVPVKARSLRAIHGPRDTWAPCPSESRMSMKPLILILDTGDPQGW